MGEIMFDHVDPNTRYGDEAHARGGLIAVLARAALERAALERARRDAASPRTERSTDCARDRAGGDDPA
jgi:hypothetical protein